MNNLTECVLLIDDDKATNFYNKKVVTKHQDFNDVVIANSGNKALDYLLEAYKGKCKKPSLIFLDINMPGMNGWEFLQEYKKLDRSLTNEIKLVMLTTSTNKDDYNKSLTYEMVSDYLNKPLSTNVLDNLIETNINSINRKRIT